MPSLIEYEEALRAALDAIGPAPRGELLHVMMLPDFNRVSAIGDLLIDAEEDRMIRAPLVGMLRERQHGGWRE